MSVNDVTPERVEMVMALAAATPQRLADSCGGLDDATLAQSPAPEEWSPLEVLHHLRACEEVWAHGIQQMLAFDHPTLRDPHPRQWLKRASPYTGQGFAASLKMFTLRREALLIALRGLTLDDWAREGRDDGKDVSVYSQVRRMVLHEERHCDEMASLLGGEAP